MANVRMASARVAAMRPWAKKTDAVLVNRNLHGKSKASLEPSDGAPFVDLETDRMRSNNHEYVFTEWVMRQRMTYTTLGGHLAAVGR
jgi:hypothetical protein